MAEATQAQPGFGKRVMSDLSKFFVSKDTPLKPANPPAAPAAPQAGVTQPPPQPKLNADGTPVLDANGKLVMQESPNDPSKSQVNPMAAYERLFAPIVADDKAPKVPVFNLSTDMVTKAAAGMDFTADLPPEVTQSLQEGKLDANNILALVNHVGRQAYARAMEHGSALTDKFVGMRNNYGLEQELPTAIKSILAKNTVHALPNVKDNPIAKAHFGFIAQQFTDRYPDMTPQEVSNATLQYFVDMGTVANPAGNKGSNGAGNPMGDLEFDYEAYLKDR